MKIDRRILGACGGCLVALSSAVASADSIVNHLGSAGPGHFAILSLGGTNLAYTDDTLNGPGQTIGNVGVASSGDIALNSSTPPAIIGNLYLGNTSNTNGSAANLNTPPNGQVQGNIYYNQDSYLGTGNSTGFWTNGNTTATGAVADALAGAKYFAGLTADPNETYSSITNSTTIKATHTGFNVIKVTGDINLGGNAVLTLDGNNIAGAQFVLDVAGKIVLNGGNNFSGGEIRVAGGLSDTDALINVTSTSTGDNVTSSGGSSKDPSNPNNTLPNAYIDGILLDAAGGIGFSPGAVYGEIIGGGNEIRLVSGSQTMGNMQESVTPLPPSALTGATLLGGLLLAGRLRRVRLA